MLCADVAAVTLGSTQLTLQHLHAYTAFPMIDQALVTCKARSCVHGGSIHPDGVSHWVK